MPVPLVIQWSPTSKAVGVLSCTNGRRIQLMLVSLAVHVGPSPQLQQAQVVGIEVRLERLVLWREADGDGFGPRSGTTLAGAAMLPTPRRRRPHTLGGGACA